MTFNELTDITSHEHREDFYELLLANSDVILLQIARTSKQQVAEAFNMHPTVFTTAFKFILAHNNLTTKGL